MGDLRARAITFLALVGILVPSWVLGATVEKRQLPVEFAGPGMGSSLGPYGGGGGYYGGYDQQPQQYAPQQYDQAPPQYGGQPIYPAFGYKDPGFGVQTGFEGFLVPNSWYGLLPWGIEGVVIVIVGIIVAMVIVVSIVALLVWLTGFGDFALVKESARSYLPDSSVFRMEYLNELSTSVLNALDRYNDLVKQE